MRMIVLSGGKGKRLWPLSHPSFPKQFIRLFDDGKGQLESILQRNLRLLQTVTVADHIFVSSVASQYDLLTAQIPKEISIILDPYGRDTFPAIALACAYLYTEKGMTLEEIVCFSPADLYVEETFYQDILQLERMIDWTRTSVVLTGVEPTGPLDKYGYIIPGQPESNMKIYPVERFIEKPDMELARDLISRHALWNSGVFVFPLGFVIEHLKAYGFPTDYRELREKYHRLPKISFDYAILEKTRNIQVMTYGGQWFDVGSWEQMMQLLNTSSIGSKIICHQTHGSYVINTSSLPLIVIGVSNLLIAVSDQGILIADKTKTDKVKTLLDRE